MSNHRGTYKPETDEPRACRGRHCSACHNDAVKPRALIIRWDRG